MSVSLLMTVFLLGLIASPHCAGMCGCALARPWLQVSPAGFYLGRVSAYVVLGALAGGLSFGLGSLLAPGVALFKALSWMLHAVLLFAGLLLLVRAKPILSEYSIVRIERLQPQLNTLELNKSNFSQGIRGGLLWLFMPCAVLYAAVSLAFLSASVWQGALLMWVFGWVSSGSIAAAVQLQKRIKGKYSESAMYRANGVLILLSLGLMAGREWGWLPTPAVLENLGLCL
ncbi:MAG: sulfite exporter TauE/SafE family protein [Limnobacter sp.]|nr:sulfite exporter TauE/SafE family protein [Limnobacter sp.]